METFFCERLYETVFAMIPFALPSEAGRTSHLFVSPSLCFKTHFGIVCLIVDLTDFDDFLLLIN